MSVAGHRCNGELRFGKKADCTHCANDKLMTAQDHAKKALKWIKNPILDDFDFDIQTAIILALHSTAKREYYNALKQEIKYLKGVAAIIEDRNGKGNPLADYIAKPFRMRAAGLEKLIKSVEQLEGNSK